MISTSTDYRLPIPTRNDSQVLELSNSRKYSIEQLKQLRNRVSATSQEIINQLANKGCPTKAIPIADVDQENSPVQGKKI